MFIVVLTLNAVGGVGVDRCLDLDRDERKGAADRSLDLDRVKRRGGC